MHTPCLVQMSRQAEGVALSRHSSLSRRQFADDRWGHWWTKTPFLAPSPGACPVWSLIRRGALFPLLVSLAQVREWWTWWGTHVMLTIWKNNNKNKRDNKLMHRPTSTRKSYCNNWIEFMFIPVSTAPLGRYGLLSSKPFMAYITLPKQNKEVHILKANEIKFIHIPRMMFTVAFTCTWY